MHRMRFSVIVLLGAILPWSGHSVALAGEGDHFQHVKRKFRQQLLSKQPEERIAALVGLRKYPVVPAAQLIVRMGLADDVDEVRATAHASLLEMNHNEAICKFLMTTMRKDFRQGSQPLTTETLLDVLLSSGVPEIRERLQRWLEDEIDPAFLPRVAQRREPQTVELLRKLSETEVFAERFAFRRATILTLTQTDLPEAVDVLIELLGSLRGESRVDIAVYLQSISLQNMGLDVEAWQLWWKNNRDKFAFPPLDERPRRSNNIPIGGEDGSYSRYYGFSIYAQRVVFVIDASTSMKGVRLETAKRELLSAIEQLSAESEFAVVAYNSSARAWKQQLQPASLPAKENAAKFVTGLRAGGLTASFNALAAAFGYDAEAMYFLSDGVPTAGRITDPSKILQAIEQLNRGRYISIYTIGIHAGAEGHDFVRFLELLAKQNAGQFREVDR